MSITIAVEEIQKYPKSQKKKKKSNQRIDQFFKTLFSKDFTIQLCDKRVYIPSILLDTILYLDKPFTVKTLFQL